MPIAVLEQRLGRVGERVHPKPATHAVRTDHLP